MPFPRENGVSQSDWLNPWEASVLVVTGYNAHVKLKTKKEKKASKNSCNSLQHVIPIKNTSLLYFVYPSSYVFIGEDI
uniref:Uncharacterized protein n=1 Tax=Glossina pallidipes TaxID=7398 RepID=A0A1B0AG11_GLOPL